MPSSYSSLLRLELMQTGEKSATWGDITNTNLGTLLEKSIAGTASVDVTAGNVTMTALNGADDQSRCMIISVTGTPGVSRNVVAPSTSKVYAVLNGSNAAIVFKGAATTGVTISSGQKSWVAWNGSDFVVVGVPLDSPTFTGTTSLTNLAASGTASLGSTSQFYKDSSGRTLINGAAGLGGVYLNVKTGTNRSIAHYEVGSVPTLQAFNDVGAGISMRLSGNTLYLSGSNGGSDDIIINSAGQVGIGTSPTGSALHVKSAAITTIKVESTTARGSGQVVVALHDPTGQKGYFGYGDANDRLIVYQGLNDSLDFYTNASFRWRMQNDGQLVPATDGSYNIGASALEVVSFIGRNLERTSAGDLTINASNASGAVAVRVAGSEIARATTTGLGLGSISPTERLDVFGNAVRVRDAAYSGYLGKGSALLVGGGTADLAVYASTGRLLFGTGANALVGQFDTAGNFGIGVAPTSIFDATRAGVNLQMRLRAGAGFIAALQLCGNNATAGSNSFDLQQDNSSNVDIVNRAAGRMSLYTNNIERLQLSSSGQLFAHAIHNNAGGAAGTTPMIASGSYTPTFVTGTNVTAVTATAGWRYLRVGNVVHVAGPCSTTCTAGGTGSSFTASLPIASNLANQGDLAGVASTGNGVADTSHAVLADTTNDVAQVTFTTSGITGARTQYVVFSYEVK